MRYWWWIKRRRTKRTPAYNSRILALGPIAYYQLNGDATDSSGNGYDGAATGATFGGTGIGDGNAAASLDGTGDVIDISAMVGAIDPDVGGIIVWGETSAWADATIRYMVRIIADTDNVITIGKGTTTNEVRVGRIAGGFSDTITSTALAGSAAYWSAAITWDRLGVGLKAFVNGSQIGTTHANIHAFEEVITSAYIGAGSIVGANSWSGSIAHVAIFDRAPSDAEVLSLGVLS